MRDCDLIEPPVVAKISLDGTSTYMKSWSGPSLDASVFYVVTNALKCVVALEVVC